jgi:hypothetical protein
MNSKVVRSVLVLGVLFIFSVESGCSSMRLPAPMSSDQTSKLQERVGNIGVVSVRYNPRAELQTPGKGRLANAGRGAAELSKMTFNAGAEAGNPGMVIAAMILAPIMAVAGGVSGALMADSPDVVAKKEAALHDALSKMRMQEAMRDRFLEKTSTLSGFHFTKLDEEGPLTEVDQPDYRSLKKSGIDTIQELAVQEFGLAADNQLDPDLLFYMQLQARLVDTADNKPILIRTFTCESGRHKFAYWSGVEAQKFREEIDRCYDDLADQLITAFYVYDTVSSGLTGRERPLTGRPR